MNDRRGGLYRAMQNRDLHYRRRILADAVDVAITVALVVALIIAALVMP